MANSIAKHYARLLTLWPKDAFRPNQPFTRTLEHRALPFGPASNSASKASSSPSTSKPQTQTQTQTQTQSKTTPTTATATATTSTTTPSPQLEVAQLNALYSLLENRYAKKYTVSDAVLNPSSSPQHYTLLMREIERAPGKSWWTATVEKWKGMIRWK